MPKTNLPNPRRIVPIEHLFSLAGSEKYRDLKLVFCIIIITITYF